MNLQLFKQKAKNKLVDIFGLHKETILPQWFWEDYKALISQSTRHKKRFKLEEVDFYPCIEDKTTFTGFDRHYVYHPAWAARILKKTNTTHHIDISSTLYFCSIVSAFLPVSFYDYRPANLGLSGLNENSCDLTNLFFESNSVASLSCMHTIEHIGLGRYGDPIEYEGDLKAMKELARVLRHGGNLLFVTPVGHEQTISFNAHRIYTPDYIVKTFQEFGLKLVEFTMIPEKEEDGGMIVNPSNELVSRQKYACGCFWFTKAE